MPVADEKWGIQGIPGPQGPPGPPGPPADRPPQHPWHAGFIAGLVSLFLGIQTGFFTLLGAAISDNSASSPWATWQYIQAHWWGVFLGVVVPVIYRVQQGATKRPPPVP